MTKLCLGLVRELKRDFPWNESPLPRDADSELLSTDEERELIEGLESAGYDVGVVGDAGDLVGNLAAWKDRCDLVFNKSVGYTGVDRKLVAAAVLEAAGIPYTGSAPGSLALTRNKHHAKLIVQSTAIATPASVLMSERREVDRLKALEYPVIVKPVAESSSIGIGAQSVVDHPDGAGELALELIKLYRQPAVVESFVPGYDIEVPLVADPELRPLDVIAFKHNGQYVCGDLLLTSELVYDDDYELAPAPDDVDVERVKEAAVRAATVLEVRDYGRIDFRLAADGTPFFIEASTHPHIQRHSGFCVACRWRGLHYADMLRMIVSAAARRYGLIT
ncbi:MAG: hypothetical protein WB783_20075 [Arenicellales bacterium]